jgi:hypothetical protein
MTQGGEAASAETEGGRMSLTETRQAGDDRRNWDAALPGVQLGFKDFLVAQEGLLLPDRPSVPGKSRLNTSIFPRSRYKAHPNLLPPVPQLPRPRRPGL